MDNSINDLDGNYILTDITLDLDGDVLEQQDFGVPKGAIGWRSLLNHLVSELGKPDFAQVKLTDLNSNPEQAIYGFKQSEGTAHWLLVSFVTSELFEKQLSDPEVSGWGYELTVRCAGDGDKPPQAGLDLMNAAIDYQVDNYAKLGECDTLDFGSPEDSEFAAEHNVSGNVVVRADPRLRLAVTPLGSVAFRQVVEITRAESDCMLAWDTSKVVEKLSEVGGELLISGLGRSCLTADADIAAFIERQIETEGSSGDCFFAYDHVEWKPASMFRKQSRLTISESMVSCFCRRLKGRIPFDRPLKVYADELQLTIESAAQTQWQSHSKEATLRLTHDACRQLIAALQTGVREFAFAEIPKLQICVESC